jgi:hypothetical protein
MIRRREADVRNEENKRGEVKKNSQKYKKEVQEGRKTTKTSEKNDDETDKRYGTIREGEGKNYLY